MILDKLSRIELYRALLPHLDAALSKLEEIRDSAPGRYDYDGGFILIQEGTTKPLAAGDFEAHRKYLDVQVLLSGAETIAWADLDTLSCTEAYDAQKDRGMYAGTGASIAIAPGMFYVCFPADAHKACGHLEAPTAFRKAVVKLRLEN